MINQRLLELIRKEDVLLFAGAGMSIYSGYPSGLALAKILFNNLSKDEQRDIEYSDNLPRLADDIFNLKNSKQYLFQTLKMEFSKEPSSTATHDLLAKIPHFKTIITTNYDTLFETTNKNLEIIRRSKDIPISDQKKQWLYKIHGDFTDTDRIILTASDYNNYFSTSQEETIFWNSVKNKLATHHVVFVGYSMDDINTQVLIDKISNELGENRKEMFFVAPKLTQSKINYLQRKNITVIRATGEDFINECYEDLKANYFPGLSKGNGSADIALTFARFNNIELKIGQANQSELFLSDYKTIKESNGLNEVKFNLVPENQRLQYINDSLLGKNFDNVVLKKEEIENFSVIFEGIKLRDDKDIQSLTLQKLPNFSGSIDVNYSDGLDFEDIYVEMFLAKPSENELDFKFLILGFEITMRLKFYELPISGTRLDMDVKPIGKISSVSACLKFYKFLNEFISNKNFNIYNNSKQVFAKKTKTNFKESDIETSAMITYFENLKKIEKLYNLKFRNIKLEEINKVIVRNILAYNEKIRVKEKFSGLTFGTTKAEIERFINDKKKTWLMVLSTNKKVELNLHGESFEIGYAHQIIEDAYIENTSELKLNNESKVKIASRSKTMFIQFSDDDKIIKEHKE